MPTSYTLLADDVWRCILPHLTLGAVHHLAHLDTHLYRTLAREPFASLILTDCCRLQPVQLDAALKGGRSAASVMRQLLSGAAAVEELLGGGCGLGQLHQATLLHSLLCAMQYSDEASPSCHASTSSPTTLSSASASQASACTCAETRALSLAHLSLAYFYDPPHYPLPSPLRVLSASTSPAAHFPFPHAYCVLWLQSRWHDERWMAAWVAARARKEESQAANRQRWKEMQQQYNSDTSSDAHTSKAETDEPTAGVWTPERHMRVAAATLCDLSRCIRWLGEFASPSHEHGEVFGYLTAPISKRQGTATRPGGRDYEYAYIDELGDGCEAYQPPAVGGWDVVPVVSWRVVSAPSRMRFALTVWPCLYVYMRSQLAPGLIDGWTRRVRVTRPAASVCSVKGRMFLHTAGMERWERLQ